MEDVLIIELDLFDVRVGISYCSSNSLPNSNLYFPWWNKMVAPNLEVFFAHLMIILSVN